MMQAKRGVRIAAREAMMKFGYDPLETMVIIAQDDQTAGHVKLQIAETLLPYMYPKLSNVTVETTGDSSSNADSQAILLRRILENPELADAAQRLSIAASMAALESDFGEGPSLVQ
jgi:hypothetical protein